MVQVFHPVSNTLSRISLLMLVLLLLASFWLIGAVVRSSYATQANVVVGQPVPFSHRHHVRQLGIDCRYCHWSVEDSRFAGMPATEVCIGCHKKIWADSPLLEPVRQSFEQNRPIAWNRVHDLPDFTYFNHRIHIAQGIGCSSCHGPVDNMPLMWRTETLHMDWCLECHRHPEVSLRPRDQVYTMQWPPADGTAVAAGEDLARQYRIDPASKLTNCSICHR